MVYLQLFYVKVFISQVFYSLKVSCGLNNGSNRFFSPKYVYFYTDQSKYLFSCGEGTPRRTQEHRMRFAKLENIFLTSLHCDNIDELPEACLTVQEIVNTGLTLHGSELLFQSADKILILNELSVLHSDCLRKSNSKSTVYFSEKQEIYTARAQSRKF